jgi:ABC-type phosphate transport system substrate-binding protein
MKHIIRSIAVLAALWAGPAIAADDEIVVIVNAKSAVRVLTRGDLRPIYQTTKTSWDNGDKILPLQAQEGNSTRNGFDAAVLGLDPERVQRFWVDRKIRGGNPPPKAAPNGAAILKIVGSKAEAIGYVEPREVNANVRIVARIRGGQVVAP